MPRDSWLALLDERDASDPRYAEAAAEYDRDKKNETAFRCSRRKGVYCPAAPGSRGSMCRDCDSIECPLS